MDLKEKIKKDLKAVKTTKFYVKQALETAKIFKENFDEYDYINQVHDLQTTLTVLCGLEESLKDMEKLKCC